MTKQTSNSDIEDVLSSIRRLVSEDRRAGGGGRALEGPGAPALMLTPRSRIDEDDTDSSTTEGGASTGPMLLENPLIPEVLFESDRDDAGQVSTRWMGDGAEDSEAAMTAAALHALHGRVSGDELDDGRISQALEDKIAELQAMVAQVEDRQEAAAQRSRGGGETIAGPWPERKEMEGTGVDEDALRSLIAEVVREELEGDLGERITRNVRKLVRREVQRALSERSIP